MNKRNLLLKKEMLLTASPRSYVFIAFAFMALIPQYPILLGAFFVCLGIFGSFQACREAGDIFYTAMLPVAKRDVVISKYIFTVAIQMLAWILMFVLTQIRMTFLADVVPYSINTLMNANHAYLGWNLMIFAAFNTIFVGKFFKTAYKLGIPFLLFGIAATLIITIGESLHFFPGMESLNDTHFALSQLWVLATGIILYLAGTAASLAISIKRFEKIDL